MAKENSAESGEPSPPNARNEKQQTQFNMLRFLNGTIAHNWEEVEKNFRKQMVNGRLFKDKFGACLGFKEESKEFAETLFDVLAKRKEMYKPEEGIALHQLEAIWNELNTDDLDQRIKIFFDLCDQNGDSKISTEEMEEILKWTVSANKLKNIKDIKSYASLIVRELDPDKNGFIEYEHMKLLITELWDSEEAKMLQSPSVTDSSFLDETKLNVDFRKWKNMLVLTLWVATNLGLFVWKFMENKAKEEFKVMGYCIGIAKGSAETLKFNMALALFLVCRGALTTLGSPFDDHIYFHMMVGIAIAAAAFIHMIMHLGCGFPILLLSTSLRSKLKEILGPSFESKEPSYFDLVSSVPGVTGTLMVIMMTYCFILGIPSLRKSDKKLRQRFHHLIGFNAFWYAHHLLFLVYVLMILHGYFKSLARDWLNRTTWMYIAFPILLYTSENFMGKSKSVNLKKVVVYSKHALVALQLEKPKGFKYESGMYLFVKCKDISKFEWHPFSLTSAPGDDYLSLHIRNAGDWTENLISRFEEVMQVDENEKKTKRGGIISQEVTVGSESSDKYPQIYIKGPYGAPAQNQKKYDILLLIGLGVGATPMISILKDILNHIKENASQNSGKIQKRAYFYWVTRTQESFEWFKGVMNDVAKYDENGSVIEMHAYLSCMQNEGDAQSVLLTILQNILEESESSKPDIISGSRIRARYGKPDWKKVFSGLKRKHKGSQIGVFYCGSAPAHEFRGLCKKNSHGKTKFHFLNENF